MASTDDIEEAIMLQNINNQLLPEGNFVRTVML